MFKTVLSRLTSVVPFTTQPPSYDFAQVDETSDTRACRCPSPPRGQLSLIVLGRAIAGDVDAVRHWVDSGKGINSADPMGGTLISNACRYGQTEVVRALLSYPELHLNVKSYWGKTPLMLAVEKSYNECVLLLVTHTQGECGVDVMAGDSYGSTALDLALGANNWGGVRLLLKHHLHHHHLTTLTNALHKAVAADKEDVQRLLSRHLSSLTDGVAIGGAGVPSLGETPAGPAHTPHTRLQEVEPLNPIVQLAARAFPADDETYDTSTDPPGAVLILNYRTFRVRGNPHQERRDLLREGSEYDIENLKSMFSQMGYNVETHQDLTEDLTLHHFSTFTRQGILQRAGCAIVVVMSHGVGRQTFLTSDMEYVTVRKVHDMFLNSACPALKDKPKIFIFTFCRGHAKDSRVETDEVAEAPRDIACIYSATEGFASMRYTDRGTPFVLALCEVLSSYAHQCDLDSLLKKFQVKYASVCTADIQFMGFTKKFFFNPVNRESQDNQ